MKTPQILLISLLLSPVFSLAQYGPEIQTSRAALCWSFCTNAFIESEAIRMGKQAVNLSESYLIQKILEEKSASFLRMKGNMQFGPGGNIADGLALYQKYGALPQ